MCECTVRNAQLASDLGLRFPTALPEMHRFQFKFLRVRLLWFLHGLFPFWGRFHSPFYLLHFSGSRPYEPAYWKLLRSNSKMKSSMEDHHPRQFH